MSGNVCPQCGAPIDPGAVECKYCGERLAQQQINRQMNQQPVQPQMGHPVQQPQGGYVQQPVQQPQGGYVQQPVQQQMRPPMQQPQTVYIPQPVYTTAINPAWPVKSKILAGILAILFGGFGIHKFYMGKIGMGILYLVFCWTYIPAIVGLVEGIIYLCSNDENFQLKHHVRIG